MRDRDAEAKRLLRIALRDYRAFIQLKSGGSDFAIEATFHAQQAVEKCLKAALAHYKIRYHWTHDLKQLADLLSENNHSAPFGTDDLARLTPYAVLLRYDDVDLPALDYSEVTAIVEGVLDWVKNLVEENQ